MGDCCWLNFATSALSLIKAANTLR